jgi:hypothetical protein
VRRSGNGERERERERGVCLRAWRSRKEESKLDLVVFAVGVLAEARRLPGGAAAVVLRGRAEGALDGGEPRLLAHGGGVGEGWYYCRRGGQRSMAWLLAVPPGLPSRPPTP